MLYGTPICGLVSFDTISNFAQLHLCTVVRQQARNFALLSFRVHSTQCDWRTRRFHHDNFMMVVAVVVACYTLNITTSSFQLNSSHIQSTSMTNICLYFVSFHIFMCAKPKQHITGEWQQYDNRFAKFFVAVYWFAGCMQWMATQRIPSHTKYAVSKWHFGKSASFRSCRIFTWQTVCAEPFFHLFFYLSYLLHTWFL